LTGNLCDKQLGFIIVLETAWSYVNELHGFKVPFDKADSSSDNKEPPVFYGA
jgi:hypothetical protein